MNMDTQQQVTTVDVGVGWTVELNPYLRIKGDPMLIIALQGEGSRRFRAQQRACRTYGIA